MNDARTRLLERIVADVGANGLGDRSLRDLAVAVGSSHRMLHYHFGSRAGVVTALVEDHGIDEARLVPIGEGLGKPIADNGTEEGRAKNRRVELVKR